MILLSGFLEILLKAFLLIGMASAVGGIVFCLLVLRPLDRGDEQSARCLKTSLLLIACGSALMALSQGVTLFTGLWALADETGRLPVAQFFATRFARAGVLRAGASLCLAAVSLCLSKGPSFRSGWILMTILTALLILSGGWLVHAVSHPDNVVALVTLTVFHQVGASVWAGGILHLTILRRLLRGSLEGICLWPALVTRFSLLAVLSVVMLVSAGLSLSLHYVGDWQGLISTSYGAMVITKAALLAFALCFGALNSISVRLWLKNGEDRIISQVAPLSIKAEMWTSLVILCAAAALTSQPPAADIRAELASPTGAPHVFSLPLPHRFPPALSGFEGMLQAGSIPRRSIRRDRVRGSSSGDKTQGLPSGTQAARHAYRAPSPQHCAT
jgi:putative copper export protein